MGRRIHGHQGAIPRELRARSGGELETRFDATAAATGQALRDHRIVERLRSGASVHTVCSELGVSRTDVRRALQRALADERAAR